MRLKTRPVWNALIVWTLALTLPLPASAATTEEKLNACDAALTAKKEEASLCGLGVQLRSNEIERLQTQNAKLLDRGSAWYNNPFVFAAIGVIFGTWAGARVTR